MDAMEASHVGTREIALPVLATSLSLIVIFLPIAFMGGIVGRFFSSFGLTVAFAVAMSLFVSFTLTPMLCSRFLKLEPGEAGHAKSKSGFIYRLIDGSYGGILRGALRFKPLVVLPDASGHLQHGPDRRRSWAMSLDPARRPERVRGDGHDARGLQPRAGEQALRRARGPAPNVWRGRSHLFTTIGETSGGRVVKGQGDVTRGTIYVRMKELDERDFTQFAVQQEARELLTTTPTCGSASTTSRRSRAGGGRRPSRSTWRALTWNQTYRDMPKRSITELKERRGLVDLDTTLSLRKPEVQVIVDREAASDLGIPVADHRRHASGSWSAGCRLQVPRRRRAVRRLAPRRGGPTGRRSRASYDLTLPSPTAGPGAGSRAWRSWSTSAGRPRSSGSAASGSSPCWATPRPSRWARRSTRLEAILEGDEPPAAVLVRVLGPGQDDGRDRLLLHGRLRPVDPLHVHDPGRAVRELDAAGVDPDGPAGDGAVRPAVAGAVPHADGHLRDVRAVHAGRDREEERHLAGRRDQPAPRIRDCRGTRRSSRRTIPVCGRS